MPPTWIAEERVVFVHPGGQRNDGRIAVGAPVQSDAGEARCAIALDGLMELRPISGSSALQALLLALGLLGTLLHGFLANGGRVLSHDEGADLPLASFFGAFLRPPPPASDPAHDP